MSNFLRDHNKLVTVPATLAFGAAALSGCSVAPAHAQDRAPAASLCLQDGANERTHPSIFGDEGAEAPVATLDLDGTPSNAGHTNDSMHDIVCIPTKNGTVGVENGDYGQWYELNNTYVQDLLEKDPSAIKDGYGNPAPGYYLKALGKFVGPHGWLIDNGQIPFGFVNEQRAEPIKQGEPLPLQHQ